MKRVFSLFLLTILFCCGCFSTPRVSRYTVFSPTTLAKQQAIGSSASGLRLRMAEDIRGYDAPLFFHADGRVSLNRGLRYYAPLEVALQRSLEDITYFYNKTPAKVKIEVRDYCIVERVKPAEEGGETGLEVRVKLVMSQAQQPDRTSSVSAYLPKEAAAQQIWEAFSEALYSAYFALMSQKQ